MKDNLYLILHIAHGEPTFDVAQRTEIEGEEAWMIHGWRAYPYWSMSIVNLPIYNDDLSLNCPPMPADWPWFLVGMNYPGSAHASPPLPKGNLLKQLGLGLPSLGRRI
jgi:hypothetical protein